MNLNVFVICYMPILYKNVIYKPALEEDLRKKGNCIKSKNRSRFRAKPIK